MTILIKIDQMCQIEKPSHNIKDIYKIRLIDMSDRDKVNAGDIINFIYSFTSIDIEDKYTSGTLRIIDIEESYISGNNNCQWIHFICEKITTSKKNCKSS